MIHFTDRAHLTRAQRRAILERQDYQCPLCLEDINPFEEFDVDHEHAISLGGTNDGNNLRAVHQTCHRAKTRADVQCIAKADRSLKM